MSNEARESICRGPRDTDEALEIAIAATAAMPFPEPLEQKLASALVDILICKQLQTDPSEAKQAALLILSQIEDAASAQDAGASSSAIDAREWPSVHMAAGAP